MIRSNILAAVAAISTTWAVGGEGFIDSYGRPIGTAKSPILYSETGKIFVGPQISGDQLRGPIDGSIIDGFKIRRVWRHWIEGVGIGAAGLVIANIDGIPGNEIIAGAGNGGFGPNNFWKIYRRDSSGQYIHAYISGIYADSITSLKVIDFGQDGQLDVCIGVGSRIIVYHGATRAILKTITTGALEIRGLSYADVDADGAMEFVFCSQSALFVANAASGASEGVYSGFGGRDLEVGNVDADSTPEIVIGNNTQAGYVLNGQSRSIEWTYFAGFGSRIRLGNIDADSMLEVVGANDWDYVTSFDADIQSPKWQANTDQDVTALRIADLDRDGDNEVLYGDGQWGEVHVLNGLTGAPSGTFPNPEHSVTDIAIGSCDGDASNEVVFGAGHTSSGSDYLFVYDSVTSALEWRSEDVTGPFYGIEFGDVDGDGGRDIALASFQSESGYDEGRWFVFDGSTGNLEYASNGLLNPVRWVRTLAMANVDSDPQLEVFIAGGATYDGLIICYDGANHTESFRTGLLDSQSIATIRIADVDLDGRLEMVVSTRRETTGATGTYVYVYDAETGAQEWRTPISLGVYWANLHMLRVANVDADSNPEIVVADHSGSLYIFDGVTHQMQLGSADFDLTALDLSDLNGDGISEIVAGDLNGVISTRSALTGSQLQVIASAGSRVDALRVADVVGSNLKDIVFTTNGRLKISYAVGRGPYRRLWSSEDLGFMSGAFDGIEIGDPDMDGNPNIAVSEWNVGVSLFEIIRL